MEPRRDQYVPEIKMTKDKKSHDHIPNQAHSNAHDPVHTHDHSDNQAGVGHVDADVYAHGLGCVHERSHTDSRQTFRFRQEQREGLLPHVEI